jgi:hypothetical protein
MNHTDQESHWRKLIDYWELSPEWQKEARSNSDQYEFHTYVEPQEHHVAGEHILLDLSEAMHLGHPDYDCIISCTNSTSIAAKFNEDCTQVRLTFL